jgi:hypothetical protein
MKPLVLIKQRYKQLHNFISVICTVIHFKNVIKGCYKKYFINFFCKIFKKILLLEICYDVDYKYDYDLNIALNVESPSILFLHFTILSPMEAFTSQMVLQKYVKKFLHAFILIKIFLILFDDYHTVHELREFYFDP